MDPFWHHNRYWMTHRKRRPMGRGTAISLLIGGFCAVTSLFYAASGRDGTAILYAMIGLGVMLIAAWRIRR